MHRSPLVAILGLLLLSAGVRADTIKVKSGLATDLQAAIDGAIPGDLISVSGGPYEGNFTVPAGKDGLTIKGKVIIHAQGAANAFLIESDGVTLSGFTVRQALEHGIAGPTVGTLAGIAIEKCTFVDCGGLAVLVTADDALVSGSVADGCQGGYFVDGDRALVTKSKVFNSGAAAVTLDGDDGQVSKCVIMSGASNGIDVSGAGTVISSNKISNVQGFGIEVTGGSATVKGNTVEGSQTGVSVGTSGSEISKNKVKFAQGICFSLVGSDLVVTKNTAFGSMASSGFDLISSGGALIEANAAECTAGHGFDMNANDAMIRKNKAIRCGGEEHSGFLVAGTDNTIEDNAAESCDDSGFRITEDGNNLTGNKAIDCGNNGFVIAGLAAPTGVILDGNTAKGNGGEGIHNAGVGTVLRDNTCSKNQLDVGNETGAGATIVDGGGNKVGTGGDFTTEPKIPD